MKRDQLLRNVTANNIAFYKNQFPIEVNIEAHKMGEQILKYLFGKVMLKWIQRQSISQMEI